jgi:hypothetical protein
MKKNQGLKDQLASYSLSARSRATLATLRQRLSNWSAYAAATGSVVAMATSTSANTITSYSGPPVTATLYPNSLKSVSIGSLKFGFSLLVASSHRASALAGSNRTGNPLAVLRDLGGFPKKLDSGQVVSSLAGNFEKSNSVLKSVKPGGGGGEWVPGVPGFEGFEFAALGRTDYGWAELEVGVNGNGVPDSLTLLGLAYDHTGAPIETGQTASGTPEPGSAGLMLLALGAAGVTALRNRWGRRKQQIAQS